MVEVGTHLIDTNVNSEQINTLVQLVLIPEKLIDFQFLDRFDFLRKLVPTLLRLCQSTANWYTSTIHIDT